MNKAETGTVLKILADTYGMELNQTSIEVWYQVLKDYSYDDCQKAAIDYIKTRHFKPVPADINNLIVERYTAKLKPVATLSPLEAWSMVYKAICNSNYNSVEEFKNLPEDCQKAIGTADNLREMAAMDLKTVGSVEQSHFIRTYEAILARKETDHKLKIEQIKRGEIKLIDGGELDDDSRRNLQGKEEIVSEKLLPIT